MPPSLIVYATPHDHMAITQMLEGSKQDTSPTTELIGVGTDDAVALGPVLKSHVRHRAERRC